jgi:hypothetical protein
VQQRLILAGVEMTPDSLRLVVVQRASPATFWTLPLKAVCVGQMHVNLPFLKLQLDSFHMPRGVDAEDLLV